MTLITLCFIGIGLLACFLAWLAIRRPDNPPVDFVPNRHRKDGECDHYLRVTLNEGGQPLPLLFSTHEFLRAKERAAKQPEDFAP